MRTAARPLRVVDALSCTYRVDAADRIRWVSAGWTAFADQNGASGAARAPMGRSLWEFVAGEVPRAFHAALVEHVRRSGRRAHLPFRCDSPRLRRAMALDVIPLDAGGVEFRSRLALEHPTAYVPLLDPRVARDGAPLRICSNCRHVQDRGHWTEPAWSEWATAAPPVPPCEEVICPGCAAIVERLLRSAG